VDHLGEVAGPTSPACTKPKSPSGLRVVEERLHLRDLLGAAADHERVALGQAPDAAGDAAVDEADALRLELGAVRWSSV
jgi:hypothetical protein